MTCMKFVRLVVWRETRKREHEYKQQRHTNILTCNSKLSLFIFVCVVCRNLQKRIPSSRPARMLHKVYRVDDGKTRGKLLQ